MFLMNEGLDNWVDDGVEGEVGKLQYCGVNDEVENGVDDGVNGMDRKMNSPKLAPSLENP